MICVQVFVMKGVVCANDVSSKTEILEIKLGDYELIFLVSPHIRLLDTLLTGVHFICVSHTHLPPPTARSSLALSKLPSCLGIYSKEPLIPGTGCEVLGVCRWRR